jgi:toxin ParE1/3/4
MTPQVSVLPAAERDIDGQAEYLFREASLETALRFYEFAAVAFEKLARTPGLGEQRHSSNPLLAGLRIWRIDGFPNHLIFYRPIEGGIETSASCTERATSTPCSNLNADALSRPDPVPGAPGSDSIHDSLDEPKKYAWRAARISRINLE